MTVVIFGNNPTNKLLEACLAIEFSLKFFKENKKFNYEKIISTSSLEEVAKYIKFNYLNDINYEVISDLSLYWSIEEGDLFISLWDLVSEKTKNFLLTLLKNKDKKLITLNELKSYTLMKEYSNL